MAETNGEIKVKSLKKAMDVLNCFTVKQPLGVTEISEMLGIYKSNAYDILSTFQAMGYVNQSEVSGKYYLGPEIMRLNNALTEQYSFLNVASTVIQQIAREMNELVYLTAPAGRCVYYLDIATPPNCRVMPFNLRNSTNDFLHCTSSGKSMLAFMRPKALETYLSQPLERMTENSITDKETLLTELHNVRDMGYAVDHNEAAEGVSCVGVPVLSIDGFSVGAISISGPSAQFNDEREQTLSRTLKNYVANLHIAK
jgi:IclR family KDG regulon transcriptional repressor